MESSSKSVPLMVISLLLIVVLSTYILIDYYVLDLTPSVGTYHQKQLDTMHDLLKDIHVNCGRNKWINYSSEVTQPTPDN